MNKLTSRRSTSRTLQLPQKPVLNHLLDLQKGCALETHSSAGGGREKIIIFISDIQHSAARFHCFK